MALTNKQRVFIAEYLKDFNATRAAKAAGYSEHTAYSQGQRLLKNVEIAQAIDERIMSADEAATIITDIARGDIAKLMDITTSGFTLELMIDDPDNAGKKIVNPKTKLIKKIKQKVTTFLAKKEDDEDRETIETEIELYSAHEAARDILKYRGKLVDKIAPTDPTGEREYDPSGLLRRLLPELTPGNQEGAAEQTKQD